jgi:hypothetical protein
MDSARRGLTGRRSRGTDCGAGATSSRVAAGVRITCLKQFLGYGSLNSRKEYVELEELCPNDLLRLRVVLLS